MDYLVIANPASGTISKSRVIPHICRKMRHMGMNFDVAFTEAPGHGYELARQAAERGVGAVLACGGDGTVNEIASALSGTRTAMGIIPTGSGNGLARHMGIPVDVDYSLKVIAENNIIDADYGLANGTPFFCTCGVGFDAAVSERCARERRRGVLMYLKNAINEYVKFHPEEYTIEVNGQTITERALLVVCCNASQYGNNAFIAPSASITDGELDLTIVHGDNMLFQAMAGVDILTGLVRKNAYINVIRTREVRIRRKKAGVAHIDGDAVKMPADIDVKCVPGALKLLSPTHDTVFRPIITPTTLFFRDIGIELRHLLTRKGQ